MKYFVMMISLSFFSLKLPLVLASDWQTEKGEIQGNLQPGAEISTGDKGAILTNKGLKLTLLPRTKIVLPKDEKSPLQLQTGTLRAKVQKSDRRRFKVETQSAVMGVRGTDFMSSFQPLLAESEIIVFEGKVRLGAKTPHRGNKTVGAGYWGGVGGRYGSKIGKLIKLKTQALETFDQQTRID